METTLRLPTWKVFAIALLGHCSIANAQVYSGSPRVIDGDTLELSNERIRLLDIDAPEIEQNCQKEEQEWHCGSAAKEALIELVGQRNIVCRSKGRDQYGRVLSHCHSGVIDLASEMVGIGLAIVTNRENAAFTEKEARARELELGLWSGPFVSPSEFRRLNPKLVSPPVEKPRPLLASPSPAPRRIYYRNCAAARAAGVAPIYRGQPGYRPHLDGDNDGIACEPYRRR
jgi:endonuclease YncB( thermonuclease family)